MAVGGAREGAVERPHLLAVVAVGFGPEFLDRLADFGVGGARGHRRTEANGNTIGDAPWHFPEEASFLETEDAAPDAGQVDGNDRGFNVSDDALEAAAKRQELTDAGHL